MMAAAIEMVGLSKSYSGVPAVRSVDLTIPVGEKLGLIGPNGAGKSTLFGMIAGEHEPNAGRVLVKGVDVTHWPAERRTRVGLGRTFQVARVFTSMTVADNVRIAAQARHGSRGRWLQGFANRRGLPPAIAGKLDAVGLSDSAGKVAGTLGHGDRKRLELAMALVQEPEILLLDEPTAGMAHEDTVRTIELLREICSRPELTVVCTAHDMEVIFAISERVVLLALGRVAVSGTPSQVEGHPTTRQIYLGQS